MKLIANKPCTFGGHKFLTGDEIPVNLVASPKEQEKRGVLTVANDGETVGRIETGETKFTIVVHSEKGDIPLNLTNEELSVFTDILQIPVSRTEDKQKISEMIQNIESEDLLIVLDALDGRKHVKEEVQKRVETFQQEEEQPDENGGDE